MRHSDFQFEGSVLVKTASFRNALVILLILLSVLFGGAAAIYGLSSSNRLPVPFWISGDSGPSEAVRVSFTLSGDIRESSLRIDGTPGPRATIDGRSIDSLAIGVGSSVAEIGLLRAGEHRLEIAVEQPRSEPICVLLEGVRKNGALVRVVSDGHWESLVEGRWAPVAVVGGYGEGALGEPFGTLAESQRLPMSPRFWVVLLSIAASLVLASLCGPVLDVGAVADGRSLYAVRAGWIFVSIAYASIAICIASLGGTSIGTGFILAAEFAAAGLFMLALFGWRAGLQRGSDDDRQLAAMVKPLDSSMRLGRELTALAAERRDLQPALVEEIKSVVDGLRYLAVSEQAGPQDEAVQDAIRELAAMLRDEKPGSDLAPGLARLSRAIAMHQATSC